MDFKQKYLKYKQKYQQLKNNNFMNGGNKYLNEQIGGGFKIGDRVSFIFALDIFGSVIEHDKETNSYYVMTNHNLTDVQNDDDVGEITIRNNISLKTKPFIRGKALYIRPAAGPVPAKLSIYGKYPENVLVSKDIREFAESPVEVYKVTNMLKNAGIEDLPNVPLPPAPLPPAQLPPALPSAALAPLPPVDWPPSMPRPTGNPPS